MPGHNPQIVMQYNKATMLLNRKKFDRALAEYKKCLKMGGASRELYLNMGNCYKFLGFDRMAFESYTLANSANVPYLDPKLKGDYPLALNNLGLYHFMFDQNDEAIKYYNRALLKDPEFADGMWNKATAVLKKACSGQVELFPEGWDLYGARFIKNPPVELKNNKHGVRSWDGSYVDSLVVMAEQGLGDNIQWGRYLSLLATRVGKLWVQCDHSTRGIFEAAGFNTCFMTSETDALVAVPMCDLAKYFNNGVPIAGDWLAGKFKGVAFDGEKPNVGIVWAGSASHANDKYRSVPMHRFHRFADSCNLYSLSPGFTGTSKIKKLDIKDWTDTARYLLGLDLVISVDTSVVHMAGSLGVPCFLLQPYKETDFRWGSDNMGSANMWYSSVKVFRNPQDWDQVFDSVAMELKDLGINV